MLARHTGGVSTRSEELGRFLRSRRERLSPADVDLPGGPRRRVKGLRREEVAVLANVGTTWYTWLEQGRDVRASEQVLEALAGALLLDPAERSHLFQLGGHPDRALDPGVGEVDARVRSLVDSLWPNPVVVFDNMHNALAWNQTWRFLIDDVEERPAADLNCVLLSFGDADWMAAYADLPHHQRVSVAKMRSSYSETMSDPRWPALLDRLHALPGFTELWESGDVSREMSGTKTISNPLVGPITVESTTLIVQENRRLRVTVFHPADADNAARIAELGSRVSQTRLRAVN